MELTGAYFPNCTNEGLLRHMTNQAVAMPRRLGTGPTVFPIGLGCMGMSDLYGPADEQESIATIHAALDRGITLLDTGDYYAAGANELLIGRALKGRPGRAVISVKFGGLRAPDGTWLGFDLRPAAVKNFVGYSLKRLGVERIDIYRPGRTDPTVPIEETIGAIADLVKTGYVGAIGLSEVGVDTIRRAHAVHPIADVQIEYSLISRGPEKTILPLLQDLGIGFTAYGVLSRGLLAGSKPKGAADFRAHLPRFRNENKSIVDGLARLAAMKGCSPAQLAIAWVLARGESIVPLVGARRRSQLDEALGALDVRLSPDEVAELESVVPASAVVGPRYPEPVMMSLDSER
jgi:aryl-alcohol dehydrogenase-like predicted oxidoreductase